ncbi:hypothetical protein [uncultured Bifidobacterium sp.]|uniref:hypothetical protein n=1 Tax=uncultured Bifidobacterium sp. TaxID=165187 RepID=UPI00262AD342|nr:hypothetical protein [uncultured Bifidobacterium sp.]
MLSKPEFFEVFAYMRAESKKHDGNARAMENLHKCATAFGGVGYGPGRSVCGDFAE